MESKDHPVTSTERAAVAVDWGGTKMMVALVTEGGRILAEETAPTPVREGPQACVDLSKQLYDRVLASAQLDSSRVECLGAAVPGLADRRRGILRHAPYADWRDVPARDMLQDAFGLPSAIANDVNGAALAEQKFGAARGVDDLIWITWSTGIGGAIIASGALYEGTSGIAGEFGHLVVEEGGPRCGCGNNGCLEAVAAGAAIGRAGQKLASREPGRWGVAADQVTAALVAAKAREGDEEALRILDQAAVALGRGIAMCVNVLNPQLVVIGGGVARSLDLVQARIQEVIRERVIGEENKSVQISPSGLGYNASLLGAAAVGFAG